MALEGTLEDFSLADIFQLIGIQRKTGILTLKSFQETVTVTFFNGMVVGADTSPKKLEDRIGVVLVKTGLISQNQLSEALEFQKKTLQKIGFILVNQNFLSREQLKEALQIQVMQMVYRLFRWTSGEYYFDQKARVDPDSDESIPPMSAESILMEGIHMIDEWPIIQKRIPSFDVVFRPMLQSGEWEVGEEEEEEDFDSLFTGGKAATAVKVESSEKVRLSREEDAVFRLVNGKNTVAEVIDSSKFGEFHTCKALYDLLERKIIESVGSMRRAEIPAPKVITARPGKSFNLKLIYPVLALVMAGLFFANSSDPMRLMLAKFFGAGDARNLQEGVNGSRINLVDSALVMYFYVNGALPSKLEELVSKRYLSPSDIIDPWKIPYAYGVSEHSYILAGHPPDGKLDQRLQIRRTLASAAAGSEKEKEAETKTENSSEIRFEN